MINTPDTRIPQPGPFWQPRGPKRRTNFIALFLPARFLSLSLLPKRPSWPTNHTRAASWSHFQDTNGGKSGLSAQLDTKVVRGDRWHAVCNEYEGINREDTWNLGSWFLKKWNAPLDTKVVRGDRWHAVCNERRESIEKTMIHVNMSTPKPLLVIFATETCPPNVY
jgi:hypothetical protein